MTLTDAAPEHCVVFKTAQTMTFHHRRGAVSGKGTKDRCDAMSMIK